MYLFTIGLATVYATSTKYCLYLKLANLLFSLFTHFGEVTYPQYIYIGLHTVGALVLMHILVQVFTYWFSLYFEPNSPV